MPLTALLCPLVSLDTSLHACALPIIAHLSHTRACNVCTSSQPLRWSYHATTGYTITLSLYKCNNRVDRTIYPPCRMYPLHAPDILARTLVCSSEIQQICTFLQQFPNGNLWQSLPRIHTPTSMNYHQSPCLYPR